MVYLGVDLEIIISDHSFSDQDIMAILIIHADFCSVVHFSLTAFLYGSVEFLILLQ